MAEPRGDVDRATRHYHSPLRQRQAAETRERLLEAMGEVIAAQGATDFTVQDIAQQAGVATRTVYRHFPNRQALLDGFTALLDERFAALRDAGKIPGLAEDVAGSDELLAIVPAVMQSFDALEPLSTAMVLTSHRGILSSRPHHQRTEIFRGLLAAELERFDPGEREAVFAVIRHLLSSQTWFALRKEFGLDGEAVGRVVVRSIRSILDAVAPRRTSLTAEPEHPETSAHG